MGKYKKSFKNNKFGISAPTWSEEFSVSDIQCYFEYITHKLEIFTNNPPIRTFINKIKNRIIFKIKTGYYLQLLTP